MRVSILAFALSGLLLTQSDAAAQGLFDSLKNAITSDEQEEREATYLDELVSAGDERDSCGGDGATTRLNAAVEQGLGIVENDDVAAYLQSILDKLLAASPFPDCSVSVYVTPHDAAVALADGGILVALGFLRNFKNEDEVAALLAHELSHILLDHHASDSFVETQDGFLKGLEAANAPGGMLLGFVDPNLQQSVDAAVSVSDAMYNISESMIAPAWTIKQEDEADLLGIDLLVEAGYNPRAMVGVMEIIKAQEANAAAVEANREEIYKQRVQGSLLQAFVGTNVNSTASIVGSLASVTSALVSGSDKKTHRPAEERKAAVNAYIKKFHRKHRRRAYTKEDWESKQQEGDSGQMFDRYRKAATARRAVFSDGDLDAALEDVDASVIGRFSHHAYPRLAQSEVRLKQGDRAAAIASFEVSLASENPPWQVYRSYVDLKLIDDDVQAAVDAVERADEQFGQPLGIAPFAIKVHRVAGDDDMIIKYMERCLDSGSRAHIRICKIAAGVEPDPESESSSGGAGGFLGGFLKGGFGVPTVGAGSGELPYSGSDNEESEEGSGSND